MKTRIILSSVLGAMTPLLKLVKFKIIFIANTGARKDGSFYPKKMEKSVIAGAIFKLPNGQWGLGVGIAASNKKLKTDKAFLSNLVIDSQKFKGDFYGYNGVIPGAMEKFNIISRENDCTGQMGTSFMIKENIKEIYARHPALTGKKMAIVGFGPTAQKLALHLKDVSNIIAFDVRQIIGTAREMVEFKGDNFEHLKECGLIVLLTTEGNAGIESVINHLQPEHVILSDTHPKVTPDNWHRVREKGVIGYESALFHPEYKIYPSYPTFNARSIPGCLAETVVSAHINERIYDMDLFCEVALGLGYRGRLDLGTECVSDTEHIYAKERAPATKTCGVRAKKSETSALKE